MTFSVLLTFYAQAQDTWRPETYYFRTEDNLRFRFPSDGLSFDNKDVYVEACIQAFTKDAAIIEVDSFTEPIKILFYRSREEMGEEVGMGVSGMANPYAKTLYLTANDTITPPIEHEIMHMISLLVWGIPEPQMYWLNEGLATYAENNCHGYNVSQIYRFFLEKGMLYHMDTLKADFYATEEMIGYHQAAYITEYLLTTYGVEKLRMFWQKGFDSFTGIYGKSYPEMEAELNKAVRKRYPVCPDINWDRLSKGCRFPLKD